MLDSVTKKRIKDLRDILVGKVPDPKSQVDQITTGLIYKFMYDMDEEAIEMGGVPSFFVGDYEKYSWKNLFDAKLGGTEKVQLYSDAIENMYKHPSAPPLFREIFKNSFLPFRDPSTLNMFLKEINGFHYSHSEKLGDAFEFLLSFMGSQGDAGQFRTPRHIIDFIVEIVSPQKNETILDPACGTAGFLISSYKHILSQNTDKRVGDQLTASDRKNIGDNLVGYDISPDMTRISLVNMYLHQFASPQIHEYDSLSSEDRWNEYFDVILANPPFMTPKGGIKPHQRFGVKSNRAEVLFVDYIMEHLKPNGRAGIVVPEGIIFQTGTAYKTSRKKLVEDCLVGVISLPAGVFQPYAGVKTSILILDKELNQKSDSIFFAKVENDGFSLGAQRTEIDKNDLPIIQNEIREFFVSEGSSNDNTHLWSVHKSKVENEPNTLLSQERYQTVSQSFSEFEFVSLESVCESIEDGDWIESKDQSENGIRLVQTGNIGIGDYLDKSDKARFISSDTFQRLNCRALKPSNVLVSRLPDPVGRACKAPSLETESITSVDVAILEFDTTKLIPNYFVFLTQSVGYQNEINRYLTGASRQRISKGNLKKIEFPLPPIEVQQEIVDELEGYQKIIDGCRQVVENYKPTIDIDPSWEMVELGELVDVNNGNTLTKFDDDGDLAAIKVSDMNLLENQVEIVTSNNKIRSDRFNTKHILSIESVIFPKRGAAIATNKKRITKVPCVIDNNCMALTVNDTKKLVPQFLFNFLCGFDLSSISKSAGVALINNPDIKEVRIPLPSLDIQHVVTKRIGEERAIIEGNNKLIEIYTQKIQDRISKVWGE